MQRHKADGRLVAPGTAGAVLGERICEMMVEINEDGTAILLVERNAPIALGES